MKLAELIAYGERLAGDLEAAAKGYHVKSDQRDILDCESATVTAYVALLAHGSAVPQHLQHSVLLGAWGSAFAWDELELLQRAADFYRGLQVIGVTAR